MWIAFNIINEVDYLTKMYNAKKEDTEQLLRHNQPGNQASDPDYLQLFFYFIIFCALVGGGIALVLLTVSSDPLIIVTFAGIFIVIAIAMVAYCGFSLED